MCYPWLKPYTSHKLDPKSKPCVFIGYSFTQSAYCLEPTSHKIYTSRHVHFIEHIFPFSQLTKSQPSLSSLLEEWTPLSITILNKPTQQLNPAPQPPPYIPLSTNSNSAAQPSPEPNPSSTSSQSASSPLQATQQHAEPPYTSHDHSSPTWYS